MSNTLYLEKTEAVRGNQMLLMHEDLARARMRELQEEAREINLARRLRAVAKWQRRAESAARRARLARQALQ